LALVQQIGDPLPSLCIARRDGLSNYPAERETLLETVIAVGVDGPFVVVQRETSPHLEYAIVDATPPHRSRGEFATRDKAQAFLASHGANLPAMRSLDDMLRMDDERSFGRTVAIYFAVFAAIGIAIAIIHRWQQRRRQGINAP